MRFPCTGVILAGGLNSRFSGTNKAFIKVGGIRIVDHIYAVFKDLFDEIILITNNPLEYLAWDFIIASDIFPVRSSLTGIHAGLFYAMNSWVFITACDTPFLKKELVETILNGIDPKVDVVLPQTSAGVEPLCAVYSKQCLKPIEQRIEQQKFKIKDFFRKMRVKTIEEQLLREKDPELVSFININTPEELKKFEKESS